MQNDDGKTILKLALKYSQVDAIKMLFEHQISTVGLRGSEKKAMNFLTPEDLREILLGGLVPRESGGGERVSEVEVIGRSDNHHKDLKIEIPLSLNPVVHLGEE